MTTQRKVTKAILPVAGLGTRFLPATKAMPKEMLTVVHKPIIQYAVEEALDAGIREFIFVTGRGKDAIENHFDKPYELSDTLTKKGKLKELAMVENMLPADCRVYYTRQGEPLGLGHAVWCAGGMVQEDEAVAVLLPDDIICTGEANPLREMMDLYAQTGQSVVLCEEVPHERTQNYGVLDLKGGLDGQKAAVKGFVEKPKPEDAPSNLAVVGRYIITPRHFAYLSEKTVGKGGEIQLTDAMAKVCQEEGFWGWVSKNPRFDCGDKVGFQMANLYFAMRDPEIGPRLLPFLQQTAGQFERRGEERVA